jgi:eukaryotic-like serine/threonine-protein kinase
MNTSNDIADPISILRAGLAERYRVEREIGRGGMATVYLASDLRHERSVALKLLKPELGAVLGAERFLAEIRVTASLQHPNLLPLFDSGEVNGLLFYVMPFVSGESLRARLERERELPVQEAVNLVMAMAGALESAHRAGVIHRDLKPENVLLQDGQPIIADFGIALAVSNAGGARVTQTGLSLGTPQYMSPEQAAGDRQLDARSDVYALAAMLYEMLTGEPPHTASTVGGVLSKVMTETATPLRQHRESVPPNVEWAVAKALSKRPADRFATAGEFGRALATNGEFETSTSMASGATQASHVRGNRRMTALLTISWAITIGVLAWRQLRPASAAMHAGIAAPIRLPIELPDNIRLNGAVGVLPDGSGLVYHSNSGGSPMLYLQRFNGDSVVALTPTAGAGAFAVSPDGRRLAFMRTGVLYMHTIGSATAEPVLDQQAGAPSWIDDNTMLMAGVVANTGIRTIRLGDHVVKQVTVADSTLVHQFPVAVERGAYALFRVGQGLAPRGQFAYVSLKDGRTKVFTLVIGAPLGYVAGRALYTDGGRLYSVMLDLESGTLGTPRLIEAEASNYWLSGEGALVISKSAPYGQVLLVDSTGVKVVVDSLPVRTVSNPRLSPDASRLLLQTARDTIAAIFMYDFARRTFTRVTFGGNDFGAHWLPDGRRFVACLNNLNAKQALTLHTVDGSQPPRVVKQECTTSDVTSDGKAIVAAESGFVKLWPIDGGPPVNPPGGEIRGSFAVPTMSPDGGTMAYVSRRSGTPEVFVRALQQGGGEVQVSTNGGVAPRWTRDGRLMFREGERYMTAQVRSTPMLTVQRPQFLFANRNGTAALSGVGATYTIRPDGRSVYLTRVLSESRSLVVVLNWASNTFAATAK